MEPTPFAEQYQPLLGRNDHLPEATFLAPFHHFALQFNSLQRYWALMNAHEQRIAAELNTWPTDAPGASGVLLSETVEVDIRTFPQYLRLSVLGMVLALAEELLRALKKEGTEAEDGPQGQKGNTSGLTITDSFMTTLAHRFRQLQGSSLGNAADQKQTVVLAAQRASAGAPASTLLDDLIALVDQLAVEAKAEGATLSAEDVDVTLDHLSKLVKACEQGMITQLQR